ncbi:ABC transporter ATP-binding protein [Mediterraneibacter agrestimuris]|uniref:ABC transporter ATP-binding protein n=1 Tax=Mediterraneibacter agrestimuris TaxID=2941333 RepID=UPI00203C51E5|nr:ATP-binding cassette domain-containing protein [Mediterraneibacter agrestimuris]
MASLTLKNLNKIYPNGFVSVKDVSLHIPDGEFVTFHGPSGCGKSTILRMIGGLEDITSGEIYLGEDLLNEILPRDRQIAMAFQNYALYKHFNVYDNMALGLKLRNMPKNVIDSRVKTAAEFLGIGNILDKKIKAITDSQKQKAALGRAIVFQPKALLLDEDFAQNNEKLRSEMLRDVKRIHRKLGMTILYVTNDYDEAITLATKVVFMKDGEITEVK